MRQRKQEGDGGSPESYPRFIAPFMSSAANLTPPTHPPKRIGNINKSYCHDNNIFFTANYQVFFLSPHSGGPCPAPAAAPPPGTRSPMQQPRPPRHRPPPPPRPRASSGSRRRSPLRRPPRPRLWRRQQTPPMPRKLPRRATPRRTGRTSPRPMLPVSPTVPLLAMQQQQRPPPPST